MAIEGKAKEWIGKKFKNIETGEVVEVFDFHKLMTYYQDSNGEDRAVQYKKFAEKHEPVE